MVIIVLKNSIPATSGSGIAQALLFSKLSCLVLRKRIDSLQYKSSHAIVQAESRSCMQYSPVTHVPIRYCMSNLCSFFLSLFSVISSFHKRPKVIKTRDWCPATKDAWEGEIRWDVWPAAALESWNARTDAVGTWKWCILTCAGRRRGTCWVKMNVSHAFPHPHMILQAAESAPRLAL